MKQSTRGRTDQEGRNRSNGSGRPWRAGADQIRMPTGRGGLRPTGHGGVSLGEAGRGGDYRIKRGQPGS